MHCTVPVGPVYVEREEVFSRSWWSVGRSPPLDSVCLSDRVSISRRLSSGDVVSVFAIPPPPDSFFLTVEKPLSIFSFSPPPGRSSLSLCCCARVQQQQSVSRSQQCLPPPSPIHIVFLNSFLVRGDAGYAPLGIHCTVRRCRLAHNIQYICKAMLMCLPPPLTSVLLTCLASPPRSVARSFFFPPSSSSWREVEYDA